MKREYKLPRYIIIGAMKAGTTTLYYALTKHSKIRPAHTKELHYFSNRSYKSVNATKYKRLFHPCASDEICGEASPQYLWSPVAPENIKKLLPDVKLIALFRHPVDRCYSQFHGYLRKCKKLGQKPITKSFLTFFNKTKNNKNVSGLNYIGQELVAGSCYVNYLKKWYEHFDKDQIKVIKSEDLFVKPRVVLDEVFDFIGIEREPVKIKHHVRGKSLNRKVLNQKYPELNPELRKKLMKYFVKYNQELYELIGEDWNWENE